MVKQYVESIEKFGTERVGGDPPTDNLIKWKNMYFIPEKGPYKGIKLLFDIDFTTTEDEMYSHEPEVLFQKYVIHPNVDEGDFCYGEVDGKWNDIYGFLESIRIVFENPNTIDLLSEYHTELFNTYPHEVIRRLYLTENLLPGHSIHLVGEKLESVYKLYCEEMGEKAKEAFKKMESSEKVV